MIGHQMPFFDLRFFLKPKPAEHFAQMSTQLLIQRLAPTFPDEDNMICSPKCGSGSRTRSSAEFLSCEWLLTLELRGRTAGNVKLLLHPDIGVFHTLVADIFEPHLEQIQFATIYDFQFM
jgi:hypothetical protein